MFAAKMTPIVLLIAVNLALGLSIPAYAQSSSVEGGAEIARKKGLGNLL
jgi:hypothetical protein